MCRRSDRRESAAADIELDVEVARLRAQLRRIEPGSAPEGSAFNVSTMTGA
jgi:hypothetical protein